MIDKILLQRYLNIEEKKMDGENVKKFCVNVSVPEGAEIKVYKNLIMIELDCPKEDE